MRRTPPARPLDEDVAALRARVEALTAAAEASERRESAHRDMLATLPAVVLRVSRDGVIAYVNRILPEYASSPLIGASIYRFAPPDQHAAMRAGLDQAVRTRLPSTYETVALAPDGTRDWYHTTVAPILDDHDVAGLTLVCVNVSALKRAEHEAAANRAWLSVALKAGNVGVWSVDLDADAVHWSPELAAMFGLRPDQAPRTIAEFRDRIPEAQRAGFDQGFQAILGGAPVPATELHLDGPSGPRTFMVQGGVQHADDGHVRGILGGMVDITERRALEAQVRFAQKMEAVGQLSSGVAHNFNNMLAVILPSLEMAADKLTGPDRELIDDALQSATRAAALVRQMMAFSRVGTGRDADLEPLEPVVRRAVDLCRKVFGSRVAVTLEVDAEAAAASVAGAQVEQAVVNLLLNARDALMSGRTPDARIDVTARGVGAEALADRFPEAAGRYVEVAVRDNGPGVDDAVRGRVFEPFFTTKPVGTGTGLGLATVWAAAEAHRGFAECLSPPGQGAIFRVYLRHTHRASSRPEDARQLAPGAGRRVLMVEEEPAVARATSWVLASAGYEVAVAASGDEAIRLMTHQPFDAVVLDDATPGPPVEDTLARLRALQPGARVLGFSGLGAPLPGADVQLGKPASPRALLEALAMLLPAPA